uniref:ATP-dependent helicase SGS1 n=1 Tax=Lygus hesperus TaxID=30085 RepID=A0A0A9WVF1_LYGHE
MDNGTSSSMEKSGSGIDMHWVSRNGCEDGCRRNDRNAHVSTVTDSATYEVIPQHAGRHHPTVDSPPTLPTTDNCNSSCKNRYNQSLCSDKILPNQSFSHTYRLYDTGGGGGGVKYAQQQHLQSI